MPKILVSFLHIDELRYVANRWRIDYNHYRPHTDPLQVPVPTRKKGEWWSILEEACYIDRDRLE